MEIQELKQHANKRILLEGPSGRGKTYRCSKVVLEILGEGGTVLYADTEAEGSSTILNLIEEDGHDESIVEDLEYVSVEDYDGLLKVIEMAANYDLLILDTLDHKHSYVLKEVADAKRDGDADWNEYPQIYGEEKEIMRSLVDCKTNVIATLDDESGSRDKPKGAQTNIRGYFTAVVEMKKSGEQEWTHKIVNWLGKSDWVGKKHPELHDRMVSAIMEST